MQDFHSEILRMNLASLITMKAKAELKVEGKKVKHWHAPNMSLALAHMQTVLRLLRVHEHVINLSNIIDNLTGDLCRNSIPIRPGRIFPHEKKPQRSGFSHAYKRAI